MVTVPLLQGNILDIISRNIFYGTVTISNGVISNIEELSPSPKENTPYILPGFVDAHVHIESSLLVPSQFARLAVIHGTVGTVSDPHEIANVLGSEGVRYMLEDAKQVPFHFAFGAPSCVPATDFESAGAVLTPDDVRELLERDDIYYLAEMMNFPGVLMGAPDVLQKIEAAKEIGKPIDGHAPGLMGDDAKRYIEAGMSTDHECFTYEEARNKLDHGMKILIREGSAAKNFEALAPLMKTDPDQIMFCSDDKHPDSLIEGHINDHVKRAIKSGVELFDVLQMASKNPIEHYKLPCGLLQLGNSADCVVVENLEDFKVTETIIQGTQVALNGKTKIESQPITVVNNFSCDLVRANDLTHSAEGETADVRVIDIIPGELVSKESKATLKIKDGAISCDPSQDVLKLVVVNRYTQALPAIGYVRGFGIPSGAIASSVAHDSHNIVAAGTDDEMLSAAISAVIEERGGLSFVTDTECQVLPLPIAGLMSDDDGFTVSQRYIEIDKRAKALGSSLPAPFMTLSFLALLVIPELKLSDKGLFDGRTFQFVDVILKSSSSNTP